MEVSSVARLQKANNKGADHTAWMRRLVCVVSKPPEDRFSHVKAHLKISEVVLHVFF